MINTQTYHSFYIVPNVAASNSLGSKHTVASWSKNLGYLIRSHETSRLTGASKLEARIIWTWPDGPPALGYKSAGSNRSNLWTRKYPNVEYQQKQQHMLLCSNLHHVIYFIALFYWSILELMDNDNDGLTELSRNMLLANWHMLLWCQRV